jgi:hypothetical protein
MEAVSRVCAAEKVMNGAFAIVDCRKFTRCRSLAANSGRDFQKRQAMAERHLLPVLAQFEVLILLTGPGNRRGIEQNGNVFAAHLRPYRQISWVIFCLRANFRLVIAWLACPFGGAPLLGEQRIFPQS